MYDELVKKIQHCATDPMHCLSCGEDKDGRCFKRLMTQAADAIEELQKRVPKRPHGRLIDADALLNRDADYEYPLFDTDGSWDCVVPCYDRETIKSAPTVTEAED